MSARVASRWFTTDSWECPTAELDAHAEFSWERPRALRTQLTARVQSRPMRMSGVRWLAGLGARSGGLTTLQRACGQGQGTPTHRRTAYDAT